MLTALALPTPTMRAARDPTMNPLSIQEMYAPGTGSTFHPHPLRMLSITIGIAIADSENTTSASTAPTMT